MTQSKLHRDESRCRYTYCDEQATRTLEIPSLIRKRPSTVARYCDEHADEILSDGMALPGAREIPA